MIPAYNQPVDVPEVTPLETGTSLEMQVLRLKEQVTQLQATVDYLTRNLNRVKSDITTLANAINR